LNKSRENADYESKHSPTLGQKKSDERGDRNHQSPQRRNDELRLASRSNEQGETSEREPSLHKNTEREIDNYGAGAGCHRCSVDRGQASPNNITSHGSRGNKCADGFTDPSHPTKPQKGWAFWFRKQDPPGNGVEEYWNGMI